VPAVDDVAVALPPDSEWKAQLPGRRLGHDDNAQRTGNVPLERVGLLRGEWKRQKKAGQIVQESTDVARLDGQRMDGLAKRIGEHVHTDGVTAWPGDVYEEQWQDNKEQTEAKGPHIGTTLVQVQKEKEKHVEEAARESNTAESAWTGKLAVLAYCSASLLAFVKAVQQMYASMLQKILDLQAAIAAQKSESAAKEQELREMVTRIEQTAAAAMEKVETVKEAMHMKLNDLDEEVQQLDARVATMERDAMEGEGEMTTTELEHLLIARVREIFQEVVGDIHLVKARLGMLTLPILARGAGLAIAADDQSPQPSMEPRRQSPLRNPPCDHPDPLGWRLRHLALRRSARASSEPSEDSSDDDSEDTRSEASS